MKKILLLLFSMMIYSSCSSVKKTQKAINSGNYDEAINLAVDKLRKNKSKKKNQPYIVLLKRAFNKAVERDEQKISFLERENNIHNIENIYNLLEKLDRRQEIIKPLLPLVLHNKKEPVNFNFKDYQDKIISTKNKLINYLYDKANSLMSSGNKIDYRKAYDDLKYINELSPNYKNVPSLMEESHFKGTDFVFVLINNHTEQVIPKRLETDLLDFNTYGLNDFWTVYHSTKDTGINYDYNLQLNFTNINVSPERVKEREFIKEKEIKERIYTKDSLGNKIETVKRRLVKCELYEVRQIKLCNVIGKVNYIENGNNQVLKSFPIASEFVFSHTYASYEGDKRALTDFYLDIIRLREVPFPSNEQMIYDTGKDLKNKLKHIITSNKF